MPSSDDDQIESEADPTGDSATDAAAESNEDGSDYDVVDSALQSDTLDDGERSAALAGRRPRAAAGPQNDTGRMIIRGIGQTLLTLGVVVLLFIVYEAWFTNFTTGQKQDALNSQLHKEWKDAPAVGEPGKQQTKNITDIPIGDAFAILRVPAFGADYAKVIVQGTTDAALEKGPGHYTDTVGPGEVGNFSIAGHRVGKGSPFLNLDKLKPGAAIVFETQTSWYVYRVIGKAGSDDFVDPAYPVSGQSIVQPEDIAVIAPVPTQPGKAPTQKLLTLTTCNPKFSASQRLIVHAFLDGAPLPKAQYPNPSDVPALKGS